MTINFHEVGRNKVSWSEPINEVSESQIEKKVSKKRVLLSREIFAELSDSMDSGFICAGFRTVGSFTITK